jgi:hypothetical protein
MEGPVAAMFVNGSKRKEQSIDASYQVSYHLPILAKRLQRKS